MKLSNPGTLRVIYTTLVLDTMEIKFFYSAIGFPVFLKIIELIFSLEDTLNKSSLSHFRLEIFEDISQSSLCFSSVLQTFSP